MQLRKIIYSEFMKGLSTLNKNAKKNQKTGLVTLDHFRKTNNRDS